MKKALILVVVMALCLSLAACGSSSAKKDLTPDEARELVLSMKDEPIDDLLEIIGEPLSRDYASSCLGAPGSQDGVLAYEGFTVYTFVTPDGEETVYDVE